jgi:hypothetical protein
MPSVELQEPTPRRQARAMDAVIGGVEIGVAESHVNGSRRMRLVLVGRGMQ